MERLNWIEERPISDWRRLVPYGLSDRLGYEGGWRHLIRLRLLLTGYPAAQPDDDIAGIPVGRENRIEDVFDRAVVDDEGEALQKRHAGSPERR